MNIFTKQVWTENEWFGTYKKEPKLWVEIVGGILVMVGIWGLMILALIIL